MRQSRKSKFGLVIFFGVALSIMILVSLNSGYTKVGFSNVINVLFGRGTSQERLMIVDFRVPRIALSILVGIGLSLSGLIVQTLLRNPLADPGLIGINAGASLIVVLFIVLNGTLSFSSIFAMPFFSLFGASLIGFLLYRLSATRQHGIQAMHMILSGVAITAGINAVMMVLVLMIDSEQHEFLAKWQAGNIWGANLYYVAALLPWITIGTLYLLSKAKVMDLIALGDELSTGLGVKIVKEKKVLFFTAIALAASSVSVSGNIAFVGLIAPHLARQLVGNRHSYLIPICGLLGGLLVLTADTIARTIIMPSELPTGIVVSVIGVPYFIFLLTGNKDKLK
ncbi:FecCD family ABC transporter permease [Fusibacter bizertensis]